MPGGETITESHGTTTTNRWWTGLFTLQNVVLLGAGLTGLVTFWNNQKSDHNSLMSLTERVNRQYETNNKILDRIIEVEKKLSYEAGKSDGEREERRRQRLDTRSGN